MAISKIENASLASGVPQRSQLPAGTVLQVVNATYGTSTSTSSSTYVDTGLTASITPTSSTSKILVFVNVTGIAKYISNTYGLFRLVRNSTALLVFEGVAGITQTTGTNGSGGTGCTYLDSPATTSSTTYKAQFASNGNTATIYINDGGPAASSITLMEIAA